MTTKGKIAAILTALVLAVGGIFAYHYYANRPLTGPELGNMAAAGIPQMATPSQVPSLTPEDIEFRAYYEQNKVFYGCSANDGAKAGDRLYLCPRYTVTVERQGFKASTPPKVTYGPGAQKFITVKSEFHEGCGVNETGTYGCMPYWQVTWHWKSPVIDAGSNEHYSQPIAGSGASWLGPNIGGLQRFVWYDDNHPTDRIEVYGVVAGTPGTPLDPEKYGYVPN